MSAIRRFTPERLQALNRAADAMLLVAVSVFAVRPGGAYGWIAAACLAVLVVGAWIAGSRTLRHYDTGNGRGALGDVALTLVLTAVIACAAWAAGWIGLLHLTPAATDRFLIVVVPSLPVMRWALVGAGLRRGPLTQYVLVIGTGPLARHTARAVDDDAAGRAVIGHLRWTDEATHVRLRAPVLGSLDDLEPVLREHVVDEVYIAFNRTQQARDVQNAIAICERFGVPFALPVCAFRLARARPLDERAVGDGYVHYACVQVKRVQLALKRAVDIAVSGLVLLALSPLMAAVVAAIKVTSRGPVLFRQERVGLHGRTFHMLKFRSMVADAESRKAALMAHNEQAGPVFKMAHDPRVTAVGRFIRKYSVDELPQLVNVLRGDMSIVGPRPPLPGEVARYEAWQRRRLSVRPGLTCVWQVSGRNAISFDEWMLLDLGYIDHWNLTGDLSLMLKTLPVVLTGRGAS